jgi:hypothetical protein
MLFFDRPDHTKKPEFFKGVKAERTGMNPREARDPTKPTRLAITMSIVYPGLGQFIQRRYLPGVLFMLAATSMLIPFIGSFVIIMINLYGQWLTPERFESAPSFKPMLVWLFLLIFFYAAAVMDASMAYHRQSREWSLKTHRLPPDLPHN